MRARAGHDDAVAGAERTHDEYDVDGAVCVASGVHTITACGHIGAVHRAATVVAGTAASPGNPYYTVICPLCEPKRVRVFCL